MPVEPLYNEKELLLQVAEGDEIAFTRIFHMYKHKLYSFILQLSGSPAAAKDVLQEVFLKIWHQRTGLPKIENLNAYLFRMAQNQAINGLRRQAREALVTAEISRQQPDNARAEETVFGREVQALLYKALDRLPLQQRKVFELSRNEGLTYEEIAARLDISVSTVRNHMVQSLKNIRAYILASYPVGGMVYCVLLLAMPH